MTDRDSIVIALHESGLSYRQIALQLGVTRNVVSGIMQRVKKRDGLPGRTYTSRAGRAGPPIGSSENAWESQEARERIFARVTYQDDPRALRDHGSPGRPIIGMRNGVEFGRAG